MDTLKDTVQSKTAVPTAQVYVCLIVNLFDTFFIIIIILQPLFISLSQIWSEFQDEVVLLSVLNNLLTSLSPFTKVTMYALLTLCCPPSLYFHQIFSASHLTNPP